MGFIELSSLKYLRTNAHDSFPYGAADASLAISTTPLASLRSPCRSGVEVKRDAEREGTVEHDDTTPPPFPFRSDKAAFTSYGNEMGETGVSLICGERFAIEGVKIAHSRDVDIDRYSMENA